MKRVICALIFLTVLTGVLKAQEVDHNTARLAVGFATTNFDFLAQNVKGLDASGQLKFYGQRVRLEGVVNATYFFQSGDYFQTYLGGPQVAADILDGKLTPFARFQFGAAVYDGNHVYGNSVGFGIDVNVGKRAFVGGTYDKQNFTGVPSYYKGTVRVGARF